MSKDKTRVLFRAHTDGDIVAIFPDLDEGRGLVTCYAHVGQHGSASLTWARESTRAAKPGEYAALARELESIGYALVIARRP